MKCVGFTAIIHIFEMNITGLHGCRQFVPWGVWLMSD